MEILVKRAVVHCATALHYGEDFNIVYRILIVDDETASGKQVLEFISKLIEKNKQSIPESSVPIRKEMEAVKNYVYEHYSEELSIEKIAEQVYMAPSYLSALFKKETGENISKFIKDYRMKKAKELLEETHEKIVNVSVAVGYPNVSYFCQSFREYFGVSPQKFRSQARCDVEE